MALENVQLQVVRRTKEVTVDSKGKRTSKGTAKEVKYPVIIQIDKAITDFFNIPVITADSESATLALSNRKAHTKLYFNGVDDATGTSISVDDADVLKGLVVGRVKTARLAMEGKLVKAGSKRLRTCSIRFPSTFSNLLIAQALGTMITAKRPGSFKIDGGGRYPLVNLAGKTGLLPGAKEGCWVSTGTPVTQIPEGVPQQDNSLEAGLNMG